MRTVVPDLPAALPADGPSSSLIDQIVREGAVQMLAAALRVEVTAPIDRFAEACDEDGLIESAQRRWRMVNAPHLVALARIGVTFTRGKLAERSDNSQMADLAAEAA